MRFAAFVVLAMVVMIVPVCAYDLSIELPGGVFIHLIYVPPDTFFMGSPIDERGRLDNEDLHQVTLTGEFYLGQTEVTQAQWQAVMGSPMPMSCGDQGVGVNHPVNCVSWYDIAGPGGFLEKLDQHLIASGQAGAGLFRLPSEAEWEMAARAGTQTRFSYGDVLGCDDLCSYCVWHEYAMLYCANSDVSVEPVASRWANDLGFFDMQGNASELVQDWYEQHPGTLAVVNPTGPDTGQARVLRGGDWSSVAKACRSASRASLQPDAVNDNAGFRLARSVFREDVFSDGFESGDTTGWSTTVW